MAARKQHECSGCEKRDAKIVELEARLADVEAKLAAATKDSSNSSKPPSSDIVNPPKKYKKPGRPKKRKKGAQPGHPRHQRTPFTDEEIDQHWDYRFDACPCCGGTLQDADEEPKVLQQIELPITPAEVEEHRAFAQQCTACGKTHHPQIPDELRKAGLVGPRLTALVGWLKGVCHMSYSNIRKYFRDVMGVPISRGMLRKLVGKVSASLQEPYDELLTLLTSQEILNVDETGHKDDGQRMWTWCFRANLFTVFKISPSRGSQVLVDVLGEEFDGVLGCDYFSAYRKYMRLNENVTLQFCLAHLIRDVKFMANHPDEQNQQHGRGLVELLRKLFGIIHRREEYASEANFRRALTDLEAEICWVAGMDIPETREAKNLAERFYRHVSSYFRFLTTPGIEPTNNLAEQAIRFVAIHRRMTQGTRGKSGQAWFERMATAVVTCEQQSRSFFEFLTDSVSALFAGAESPSLAPPDTS